MVSNRFDAVCEALFEALAEAPDSKLKDLKQALSDYEQKSHTTYARLSRHPAFNELWAAMHEAIGMSFD